MLTNRIREFREHARLSQQELAQRAGLSRAAISAIEIGRGTPSTAAALRLARTFGTSVEALFTSSGAGDDAPEWAFTPGEPPTRFWQSDIGKKTLRFPCEPLGSGMPPHDGMEGTGAPRAERVPAPATLVIAGCDPAVGVMAAILAERGVRVLAFTRSSRRALELLAAGRVHAAGIHFSGTSYSKTASTAGQALPMRTSSRRDNRKVARELLAGRHRMLRLAIWEEGIAFSRALKLGSMSRRAFDRLRWVAREPGSGARECLDAVLGKRRHPSYRHLAADHREVATVIRAGWADAGVCVRLAAAEARLGFRSVRREAYDLCFAAELEQDPRFVQLVDVVRSIGFRRTLGELPGYETDQTGELATVA